MHNPKYANSIYTFDIETTTTESKTIVYLGCFCHIPFDLNISREQVERAPHKFVRSWEEINTQLENINAYYKRVGKRIIIYIHNLAYEFDGLITNCPFVREHFSNNKSLFQKPRNPLYVQLDFVELRCSFQFTRKSLKILGQQYGFEKLELDYSKKYYPFSKLPQNEYTYNKRDVDLTAYAVIQTCKTYNYINKVDDIPLTATGLVRMANKALNTSKDRKYYVQCNEYQRRISRDEIKWYESVFTGGYTHAAAAYAFRPLRDVYSIDITSSYPDVMLHRDYPYWFKECTIPARLEFFKFITKSNNITLEDYFNNTRRPFERAFMARIVIKNVITKKYNGIEIPYISISKIINEPQGCIIDNGRLVATVSEVVIDITEIDYWLINQFYNFELVDVQRLKYTAGFRPLAPYVIKSVKTFLTRKSELKSVVKKNPDKIELEDVKNTYTEEELEIINKLDDKMAFIKKDLQVAKENLNSEYGVNVQKLYPDKYNYNLESDDYDITENNKLSRALYRNFVEGLYITAYARLTLFSMFLYLVQASPHIYPIYADTDSWKIYTDGDIDIPGLVESYNNLIEQSCKNSEDYGVGYFDYEGKYDYFLSWGCKKYLTANDNKITCTIAGIPKIATSKSLTEYLKLYDIDYIFDTLAKCNILIPYELTGKLSAKYNKDYYNIIVKDENGVYGACEGYNMVELVETDYSLVDNREFSNYNYIKYVEIIQNRRVDTTPLKLTKGGFEWQSDFTLNG